MQKSTANIFVFPLKPPPKNMKPVKRNFYAALTGTVLVALCCFTPILVITFAVIGLSAFTPYLDYVLFPALGLLLIVTFLTYLKWKQQS